MMRELKRIARRIGHRGAFLLFLSLLDILFGSSLMIDPGTYSHYHFILPLESWALLWVIIGAVLLGGAFVKKDRVFYGIATTIKVAWAFGWVSVLLRDNVTRGWAQVVVWAAFAGLVVVVSSWPEVHSRWTNNTHELKVGNGRPSDSRNSASSSIGDDRSRLVYGSEPREQGTDGYSRPKRD